MGRRRKDLHYIIEGRSYVVRLRHPVYDRVVRIALGDDPTTAEAHMGLLRRIWADPGLWRDPPADTEPMRTAWLGDAAWRVATPQTADTDLRDAIIDALRRQLAAAQDQIRLRDAELEHWRGRRTGGLAPTIAQAIAAYMERYAGRDADWTRTVRGCLDRFGARFGAQTLLDAIPAQDIAAWLDGLKRQSRRRSGLVDTDAPLSVGRKLQIRIYVVALYRMHGLDVEIATHARARDVGRGRAIRYLTRQQALDVGARLKDPYRLAWEIQVSLGLRPDELLTLRRCCFSHDFARLTLAQMEHLTLKTGPRVIPIPPALRERIRSEIGRRDVLFEDDDGGAWQRPKAWDRRYSLALAAAAARAGVLVRMDCRIGRRTCASLLMQSGVSADKIAALLGNTTSVILRHYGDPDVGSLDLTALVSPVSRPARRRKAQTGPRGSRPRSRR
jgi:hypothetical protein